MAPPDVNSGNQSVVWHKLYDHQPKKIVKLEFNIGDQGRISKARRTFKKGYLHQGGQGLQ